MAKKTPALKLPSQQAVNHLLTKAYTAPQASCEEANATQAAIKEVADFFNQMRSQADGSSKPQASASPGGN